MHFHGLIMPIILALIFQLYKYTTAYLFIPLLKDILVTSGLVIINKTAINVHIQAFTLIFSTALGKYQGVKILGHIVKVCSVLYLTSNCHKLSCKCLHHPAFLPTLTESFCWSTFSLAFNVFMILAILKGVYNYSISTLLRFIALNCMSLMT